MRIFVTGSTGLIGSHFINLALKNGHTVYALRRSQDTQPRIPLELTPIWITKRMDDLDSSDFEEIDIFVHLAAHSMSAPYDSYENCLYWNLFVPIKVCTEARKSGVNFFLIAGSCFEYGKSGDEFDFIPEDAELKPTNTYAISKALSSIAFKNFAVLNNVSVTYLRIFQVYGEGEVETRLWPSLRNAAISGKDFPMTKGEQIRDFIEVSEVAKYFLKEVEMIDAIENNATSFRVKNVGSGRPKSILEFSQYWWNRWGAKGKLLVGVIPYNSGEVMRYVSNQADNSFSIFTYDEKS